MASRVVAVVLALAASLAAPAAAQDWPTKPVRLIIGFAPGGSTDVIGRSIGEYLTRVWGQPVVVESKPGAASNVAADHTAKSPPDGHTLLIGGVTIMATFKALYEKLPYDADKDLVAVNLLTRTPMIVETNALIPPTDFKSFIDWLKKESGKTNFGSPGIGTTPHVAGEFLRMRIGVESTHIPYRGTTPFIDGFLKNEVQWSMDVPNTAITQKDKVRALAVTSRTRIPELPNVPTVHEVGMPELESYFAFLLYAPSQTPRALVERIHRDVNAALRDPVAVQRLNNAVLYPAPSTFEEIAAFIAAEKAKWVPVIQANNIKAQ
ncbi:MAG: tripartite tricarboxylate transporter substrate binding protein [Alphaproteobacteria bacterium]|nr:tripartite tricarboxylate transporter substrate binding protein [Alphaproteobacteria bacterium]